MGSARMGADPVAPRRRTVPGARPAGLRGARRRQVGLLRLQLEEYAARSHVRAAAVARSGGFDDELATLTVEGTKVGADESIRPDTTVECGRAASGVRDPEMATPVPEVEWKVTAGNSSQITDEQPRCC